MRKIFFIISLMGVLTMNAQNVVLFDFDNKLPTGEWPYTGYPFNNVTITVVDDPSEIGNKVAKIVYTAPATPDANNGFYMDLPNSYTLGNYGGFTANVRCDYHDIIFTYKVENGGQIKGHWNLPGFPEYKGAGGWETMTFPFDSPQMDESPEFVFTRISIDMRSHSSLQSCTLYLDDITLIQKGTAINTVTNTDAVVAAKYYNLQGIETTQPVKDQIYLVKRLFESGKTDVIKQVIQ